MSEESRGGDFEDTTTDILDHDQEQEQDMRPNYSRNGRRYENHNYRNSVSERPVKKILKKKKKSNAGKICSFTGVVLVILIIGAFLLVKFQKEIESKIFSLKSPETENRTILPETKKKNLDQRSPEQNNNSGGKSSVLVKKKEQEEKEKENKSAELEEEEEPIAGLEDREDDTVETNELNEDALTEPPPHRVPISVGSSESKTTTKSDTDNTGTKLKSEITPPPEEPVDLPENPTTEHLFKAIEDGDVRMAKALIKYGVDLKKFNTEGYNTLHFAASKLNVEIMKAILESGPGKIDIEVRTQDEKNKCMTVLHIVGLNADFIAEQSHAVNAAKLLVEHGTTIDSLAIQNFTPLSFATAYSNNYALVQYLLSQGADPNHEDNTFKYSPLHLSMGKCNENIIEVLLKNKANPEALNSCLRQPIHEAAFKGCVQGIRQLVLNGIDPNTKTPHFTSGEHYENLKYILFGSTPLHFAAQRKHFKTVEHLLLDCFALPVVYNDSNADASDLTTSDEIKQLISQVQAQFLDPDSQYNFNRNSQSK